MRARPIVVATTPLLTLQQITWMWWRGLFPKVST
jgi:hypothetical protein